MNKKLSGVALNNAKMKRLEEERDEARECAKNLLLQKCEFNDALIWMEAFPWLREDRVKDFYPKHFETEKKEKSDES